MANCTNVRQKGVSKDEAERRASATVSKQTGGGNKPGSSGYGNPDHTEDR